MEHLAENIACCATAAPLPEAVVAAFDEAWKLTAADAFAYFRGYSADMPNRENLDAGAKYVVKK